MGSLKFNLVVFIHDLTTSLQTKFFEHVFYN